MRAPAVLLTGMAGTGKSTVLRALADRGRRTLDTDGEELCEFVTGPDGGLDWVWRLDRIVDVLTEPREDALFLAGYKTNQWRLHDRFDLIVALTAPRDIVLARVTRRPDNPWGRTPESRAAIAAQLARDERGLLAASDIVLDATRPVAALADAVLRAVDQLR